MKTSLNRTYRFEAAHFLPNVPDGHKCKNMHGHSYKVDVTVCGPVDEKLGWIMDFGDLDELVMPLINQCDHQVLNEIDGLENPTSEKLAEWLWKHISAKTDFLTDLAVSETQDSSCRISK